MMRRWKDAGCVRVVLHPVLRPEPRISRSWEGLAVPGAGRRRSRARVRDVRGVRPVALALCRQVERQKGLEQGTGCVCVEHTGSVLSCFTNNSPHLSSNP